MFVGSAKHFLRYGRAASAFTLLLLASSTIHAATEDACSGEWYGLVDVTVDDQVLTLSVRRAESGQCIGTLQMPERDLIDAPLDDVRFDSERIAFTVRYRRESLSFSASLSEDGKLISGQGKFGNFSAPFKLTRDASLIAKHTTARPLEPRHVVGLPTDRAAFGTLEHPEIQYATTPPNDALKNLNQKLLSGEVKLTFDKTLGYLPSVLKELGIGIDSQIVVYSKTSVQAFWINPKNPRALYFRDDVAVGFIHNAPLLEFAALDPKQGVVFYTLDQKESVQPILTRRNSCLSCHHSRNTMDVPGVLLRSVITDELGRGYDQFGSYHADHRTPMEDRWGGWYVTGGSSSIKNLGNALLRDTKSVDGLVRPENLAVTSLKDRFDTSMYASPFSDIAALLVFEHQAHMTNLLVRMGFDARAAQSKMNDSKLVDQLLASNAEEIVDYLLFVEEAPLTSEVGANSAFAKSFSSRGPMDRRGRSLRQLDLKKRLLRYPCSYMIYSDAFDALPDEAKRAIYKRTIQVLNGELKDPKYARLSIQDRRAVREILVETKKDFPSYSK